MTETIEALMSPEQYQAARSNIFPSPQSLRWNMRRNKAELIEAGALTAPAGTWLIDPDKFDRVTMEIGKRRAIEGVSGRRLNLAT